MLFTNILYARENYDDCTSNRNRKRKPGFTSKNVPGASFHAQRRRAPTQSAAVSEAGEEKTADIKFYAAVSVAPLLRTTYKWITAVLEKRVWSKVSGRSRVAGGRACFRLPV